MENSHPRQLPLLSGHSGGNRSSMTCIYRCGNACSHPAPNTSGNEYFGDLVRAEMSRRGVIASGAGAVALGVIGAGAIAAPAAAHGDNKERGGHGPNKPKGLTFKAVPVSNADTFVVPEGYLHKVVMRWGDEVVPGAARFNPHAQTGESQSRQFGYNNDFVAVLPLERDTALLVVNHEYTNEELMFPGYTSLDALTLDQVKAAIAAHGLSVVELERVRGTGEWKVVTRGRRSYNRRITAGGTRFLMTGPAAGSSLLKTQADPTGKIVIGTLNNCAGGVTPWGTILSGEENFNQYFVGGDGVPAEAKPALNRYGISTTARYPSGSRKWDRVDARFDLTANPNEANRFGWIVEIDPYEPDSLPRKHTALGRFKHEGANVIVARSGHVVAYMGDDERFDYIYKFVSHKRMLPGKSWWARQHNKTLLESGDLYVARLSFTSAAEIDGTGALPSDGSFNGRGVWLPLIKDGRSRVPGMTVDQILVHTRLAADKLEPTKMDRPEDVEPNLVNGKIYVALTNNTQRGTGTFAPADEANPRNGNRHGHIFELTEDRNDYTGTTFSWTVPIVCGDPADPSTYFMGYDKSKVSTISCPDNVAFDGTGHLWISTDGAPSAISINDGLFATALSGPEAGHVKQFATMPKFAECCGPYIYEDDKSVFVAVQHPGETTGATFDNPASVWPDGDFAKPAVVVTWKRDGGRIGS
jgi:secreted PhoX family phosphatase